MKTTHLQMRENLQQSNNILSNKIIDFNRNLPSELITSKPAKNKIYKENYFIGNNFYVMRE